MKELKDTLYFNKINKKTEIKEYESISVVG
jgi:hypothetical protein